MSTASNTVYRTEKGFKHDGVPIDPTISINQGDLVYWDAAAGVAKPATTDAHAATLLGVSDQTNPIPSYAQGLTINRINSGFGDEYLFNTTTGETYKYFDKVFLPAAGTDPQKITTVSGTNFIGYVVIPGGGTITGAAGVRVPVRVICRVPDIAVS